MTAPPLHRSRHWAWLIIIAICVAAVAAAWWLSEPDGRAQIAPDQIVLPAKDVSEPGAAIGSSSEQ